MPLLRALLVAVVVLCIGTSIAAPPAVTPGYLIDLSRDGGSHPEFVTEWWYVTGWLRDEAGKQRGFQVTFFRYRNPSADSNPSAFAPKQILFAHAALSDPGETKLLRAERTARAGFGLAEAAQGVTNVLINDWSLRAEGAALVTHIAAQEFSFALTLRATQPILLQGDKGFSQKGPNPAAASYYYSLPQLDVQGSIDIRGTNLAVTGQAWFDHEWSNSYVDPQSVGWDWIGINLNDGGALMAFRMRDAQGQQRWAGATVRSADRDERFNPKEVEWTPLRHWRSPRTGVTYPIAWRVKVGHREFTLRPLMDDQENDARGSVGILYWEGAVEAVDSAGKLLGRGYLELTGYGDPARL
jgi:predicted secreted hydrolase